MKAIVLIVRGLQAGALGCYGNQWTFTPAFDALAAAGIVFDQHFAVNADPAGARRVWRSGRYHFPSHVQTANADLLSALRQRQIHTCLILDDNRPSPSEFAVGWDRVERVSAAEGEMPLDAVLEAAGVALEQLERHDNWLLWIDLAVLLPPWQVPEEFQQAYFSNEADADEDGLDEAPSDEQTEEG